jgi:hypothetical protein
MVIYIRTSDFLGQFCYFSNQEVWEYFYFYFIPNVISPNLDKFLEVIAKFFISKN